MFEVFVKIVKVLGMVFWGMIFLLMFLSFVLALIRTLIRRIKGRVTKHQDSKETISGKCERQEETEANKVERSEAETETSTTEESDDLFDDEFDWLYPSIKPFPNESNSMQVRKLIRTNKIANQRQMLSSKKTIGTNRVLRHKSVMNPRILLIGLLTEMYNT